MTGLVTPDRFKVAGAGKHFIGYITDAPTPPDIPQPAGWRMLMQVFEVKSKTDSGIELPQQTKDAEKTLAIMGRVVAQGPQCYTDQERYPSGPWCKVGDVVMVSRYTGHKFTVHGVTMAVLNEDEILAVVDNPNAISRG